jgi:hypothetical protein
MGTKFEARPNEHKGRQSLLHKLLHLGKTERSERWLAANRIARARNKVVAQYYGPGAPFGTSVTTVQTGLKQNGWNIILNQDAGPNATIIDGAAGLAMLSSTDDNDVTMLQTAKNFTPVAGQKLTARYRGQHTNLDLGICFGFSIAHADILGNIGTAATITDIACWSTTLDATDGIFTPRIRGDGDTISDGTALSAVTVNRDFELGITLVLHATKPEIEFWYNLGTASGLDGRHVLTEHTITAAQLSSMQAQLVKWLTTAPATMIGFFQTRNSTANARTCTAQYIEFEVDRAS